MKQNLSVCVLAAGASLFFATGIYAQGFSRGSLNESVMSVATAPVADAAADSQALDKIRTFSIKTHKNFTRQFPTASSVKVRREQQSTYITFREKENIIRALYNDKGKKVYQVLAFPSSELSKEITKQVEFSYPGFTVYGPVIEVTFNHKTALLILIENAKEWKRIRLVGGETDIYEEYTKAPAQ